MLSSLWQAGKNTKKKNTAVRERPVSRQSRGVQLRTSPHKPFEQITAVWYREGFRGPSSYTKKDEKKNVDEKVRSTGSEMAKR